MATYTLSRKHLLQEQRNNRIVVIDRSPLIPFAINKLLANYPHINVVGQCDDGKSALDLCYRLKPDTIVIDPDLPNVGGILLLKKLRRIFDKSYFIVYLFEHDDCCLDELLKLNIQGVVLKDSNPVNLLSAINRSKQGISYLDESININNKKTTYSLPGSVSIFLPHLSPREKQIIKLIITGMGNKIIAKTLSISVKTVESHRFNLMKKLDAHNIIDLVRWAKRLNIS
ncbi:LuxR C-terminal-related transcriptional regulator [Serratia quinivorans]|uniref:LuxR C-terminal-related transcriptional regulator n=1 Tax=Serratia quinivorans TaxID=137545 RepID=UPI002178FFBD|nr:response regulator transcription factor [Serratia quinivorans]CAI1011565.1 Capsular synthesis regulator component B [Serratia quinivorans]CAI1811695.1 Capsular synthesis regulator component B [Serratia quinivorans]